MTTLRRFARAAQAGLSFTTISERLRLRRAFCEVTMNSSSIRATTGLPGIGNDKFRMAATQLRSKSPNRAAVPAHLRKRFWSAVVAGLLLILSPTMKAQDVAGTWTGTDVTSLSAGGKSGSVSFSCTFVFGFDSQGFNRVAITETCTAVNLPTTITSTVKVGQVTSSSHLVYGDINGFSIFATTVFEDPNSIGSGSQLSGPLSTPTTMRLTYSGTNNGITKNEVATLSFVGPPLITEQPVSQTATAGTSVSFSITAAGALGYQWYLNDVAIPNATGSTLALGNVQAGNAGFYMATVANGNGSVASKRVTLNVNPPVGAPALSQQPVSLTIAVGLGASFNVVATGTAPLSYQWRKDGVAIAGATSAALILSNLTLGDAGIYSVIVSNNVSSVTSLNATLTVVVPSLPPAITSQPRSVLVRPGATVAFTVGATSTTAVSYQWKKNGVNIAGATSSTLVINPIGTTEAASYTVVASNAIGSVTSAAATIGLRSLADFGRLVNLSILTDVSAADPFFTIGTVLGGAGTSVSKPLLVRAVGPSLTPLGVGGVLPDPKLDLFSGQTLTASNDNWGGDAQIAATSATVGAFSLTSGTSKDAVLLITLTAGSYTVQVSGVANTGGIALVEIYEVP